jgi:hypothetical protein
MPTKKTTKKAPSVKKTTVTRKKSVASKKSGLSTQVGLKAETAPFMTFKPTSQTLYWIVLGLVVIAFTMWLMNLQDSVQSLYDEVDASNATSVSMPMTKQK